MEPRSRQNPPDLSVSSPYVARPETIASILDLVGGGRNVLVTGDQGIGKSFVAQQVARALHDGDRSILRVIASRASAGVPLGVLFELLPEDWTPSGHTDAAARLATLVIEHHPIERRRVVLVDNAHLLDPLSGATLSELADAGWCQLLLTSPSVGDRLLQRADLATVHLAALTEFEMRALLHAELGAPMRASGAATVIARSVGNPFIALDLVRAGRDSGQLKQVDGLWNLTGALPASARITELVEGRLESVSPSGRVCLELIALAGSLRHSDLRAIRPDLAPETIQDLRDRLLLFVSNDNDPAGPGDPWLALAHPVYDDVLLGLIPEHRRRDHCSALADHFAVAAGASGPEQASDTLRIAKWLLQAERMPSLPMLERSARLAWVGADYVLAETLGSHALHLSPSPRMASVVARSQHFQGLSTLAVATLDAALATATKPADVLDLSFVKCQVQFWGLQHDDEAIDAVARLEPMAPTEELRQLLRINTGSLHFYAGRITEALDLLEAILPVSSMVEATRAVALAPALACSGRSTEARAVNAVGRAAQLAIRAADKVTNPVMFDVIELFAMVGSGQLRQALDAGTGIYNDVAKSVLPFEAHWLSLTNGLAAMYCGLPSTAQWWFRQVDRGPAQANDRTLFHLAQIGSAWSLALRGQVAAARMAWDPFVSNGFRTSVFVDGVRERCLAAIEFADGNTGQAQTLLHVGAERMGKSGRLWAEADTLHDLVRMGRGRAATARLVELATLCNGMLVATYAEHARARSDNDVDGLISAAAAFESMGSALYAAETLGEAQRLVARLDRRRAAGLAVEIAALLDASEAAIGCVSRNDAVTLTAREIDVLSLVRMGLSNRIIAERLGVSPRTVEDHVRHLCEKLGAGSRAELRVTAAP